MDHHQKYAVAESHPAHDIQLAQIEKHPAPEHAENAAGIVSTGSQLPKGYYTSASFLGTYFASGFSVMAAVAGFNLAAPVLGIINADIGPDPNLIWVALVYTLTLSVGLTLVGRLTDIFGRRYTFVGGTSLAVIGCIVAATAQSIPALIGATTLIGLAASTQLSFHFAIAELVPMKHRFSVNSSIFIFTIPGSGFSPAIAQAFATSSKVGWRGSYYLLIAINAVALACWVIFYHPPTFQMKHGNDKVMRYIKNFDYIGTFLYVAGILLFLMGLSWGGTVYPWKSAHVIATILVGAACLVAFTLYECFATLEEPLVPMRLFKNGPWVASICLLGIGAGVFYAFAIIWPTQVNVMYASSNQTINGMAFSVLGISITMGQIVAGFLATKIGKTKFQTLAAFSSGGVFIACMAANTPSTRSQAIALLSVGSFLIGWCELITLSLSTIAIDDQSEIGTAGGVAGAVRSVISTICSAVYSTVLANRLAETIPAQVPPALVSAGLPSSSVPDFIAGLTSGSFEAVAGLTDTIQAAGIRAYQEANADAFRTVAYTSIAFTGVGIVLACFVSNVEHRMSDDIAATLHDRRTEKVVGESRLRSDEGIAA